MGVAYLEELLEVGQELRLNPYVTQMEKLTDSLQYLMRVFQNKAGDEVVMSEAGEVDQFQRQIRERCCRTCKESQICQVNRENRLMELALVLLEDIEEYGSELSVSKKRELEKQCARFEVLKEEALRSAWICKNHRMWKGRMVQSQNASLVTMQTFIEAIEEATKELDASLFQDERLERKVGSYLKKEGVRILKIVFFVSSEGKYELHISAKVKEGIYITTNQMAKVISRAMGRAMIPERRERSVLKKDYSTVIFIEKPRFQTICAVCQQKKQASEISGDNFLITDTPSGKVCGMLSDGMGSGKRAYAKSKLLLELAEKLLESNISPSLMVKMINATLVTEVEEMEFATLDLCVVDVYRGQVDFIKAGASTTYIITEKGCKSYQASSLPMGVLTNSEVNHFQYKVKEECYIVMVTDGVNEAIAEVDKEAFIYRTFVEAQTKNTKELSDRLLQKVVALQNGDLRDDMMVLVLGVWELHF